MRKTIKKSSTNKKVKNATPTIVDGIKFRSKLEVYTYEQLKKHNIQAEYESVKFTILDSFRYNGEAVRPMTYTPDFVGEEFIIECKGFRNDAFPLRWKLFKHFLYINKLTFNLYVPRNKREVDEMIKTILEKKNGR